MAEEVKIGIIGGSGFYDLADEGDREERAIRTPFGAPSDPIMMGTVAGERVAFVARHGKGHRYTPTEVPYAANIYALKMLGVKYIIAVSACGSLREDFAPGHIAVPNQLVDMTKEPRTRTFFGEGLVAHVGVAHPFSPEVAGVLVESGKAAGGVVHSGGTYVTVEGPRFSTVAESQMFRQLGFSIIGMTTSPEAYLAREAEIAYAVFAHITDYDVWNEEAGHVSAEAVMQTFHQNVETAKRAVLEAVPRVARLGDVPAHHALQGALMNRKEQIPTATMDKLRPIIGKYYV